MHTLKFGQRFRSCGWGGVRRGEARVRCGRLAFGLRRRLDRKAERVGAGGTGSVSGICNTSRGALRDKMRRRTAASATAAAMPSSRFSMIAPSALARSCRPTHGPPFRLRHDDLRVWLGCCASRWRRYVTESSWRVSWRRGSFIESWGWDAGPREVGVARWGKGRERARVPGCAQPGPQARQPGAQGTSVGWFDTGLQEIPARLTTNGWALRAEDGRVSDAAPTQEAEADGW